MIKKKPLPPTIRLKKKRILLLEYLIKVVLSEKKKSLYRREIQDLQKALKHQQFLEEHKDELT